MTSRWNWLAGAALYGAVGGAEELVVVYDAGGTVPAEPYVARAAVSEGQAREAVAEGSARLAAAGGQLRQLPEVFPVSPGPLRLAEPSRIRVRGLAQPVFAIGADDVSLAWLIGQAAEMRDRGAIGVCVAARTAAGFKGARRRCPFAGVGLAAGAGRGIGGGVRRVDVPGRAGAGAMTGHHPIEALLRPAAELTAGTVSILCGAWRRWVRIS